MLTHAVGITAPGGPEVLRVVERDVRDPGPGEVRIAVQAAAVNPTDIGLRETGIDGSDPPWVPGMDATGIVDSVGDGVNRLAPGQRVMAAVTPRRPEGGGQAGLTVVPADWVATIPDTAAFEEWATLPMNGLTAMLGLEELALPPGGALAVSGGAGLLASYVIPLAKALGATVIADAKPEDEALVRSFGADTILPRGRDFVRAIRAVAPDGVDGFFDTALLTREALPAIRDGGGIVVVRGWDGSATEREIKVHPIRVSTALDRTAWLDELRDRAVAGEIALRVSGLYRPDDAGEAHSVTEAGGIRGRAVIVF